MLTGVSMNDDYRKWVAKIENAGLTRKALAEWTGMSVWRVGRWLNDRKTGSISSDEMEQLERAALRLIELLKASPARQRWGDLQSSEEQPVTVKGARSKAGRL